MNSLDEIAGGEYTAPIAVGTWTPTKSEVLISVVAGGDGDITGVDYDEATNLEPDYTGVLSGHFYKFPKNVKELTTTVALTGTFTIK